MNLCFICLQNTETRLQTIDKQCICDGYVHTKCINEWYNHSANCPICRKATRETAFPELLPKEDINVDAIVYTMFLITVFIIVFIL
jgi:E3 ubiquitin-protein ligase DOA10